MADNFEYGYLIDETGEVRQFDNQEMGYAYSDSALAANRCRPPSSLLCLAPTSGWWRLTAAEAVATLKVRADQFLHHRRQTQPNTPSLGSTFVNPPGHFAGRLIEEAGAQGRTRGCN